MRFLSLPIIILATVAVVTPSFAQSASLTATVRPNPLKVGVAAQPSVIVGKWFPIEVIISNRGSETITKSSARMHTSSHLTVRGKKKRIGSLGAGETTKIIWQAKANQTGAYVVTVEVEGVLNNEKISTSDSDVLSATSSILLFLLKLLLVR